MFYNGALPNTRVLGLKDLKDCVRYFEQKKLFKWGELDPNLVSTEDLNLADWRQYVVDYGIFTYPELSFQLNHLHMFYRLQSLHKQTKAIRGYTQKIEKEVRKHAKLLTTSAKRPSVYDIIFIKYNKLMSSDELWSEISVFNDLPEKPKTNTSLVYDAIHYIYFWILIAFQRSALLFFGHLCTVLCNQPGRNKFLVIHGVPYAGKSTLISLLSKIMDVHRVPKLNVDKLSQQLLYAELKSLFVLDDLNIDGYRGVCENRNFLDGEEMVGDGKFEDQRNFKLPGILITTNIQEAQLLDTGSPKLDDKYYHLKTRGYHWKAIMEQIDIPKLLTKDILAVGLARILLSIFDYDLKSTIFENALTYPGHAPNHKHDVRKYLETSQAKDDYSYMKNSHTCFISGIDRKTVQEWGQVFSFHPDIRAKTIESMNKSEGQYLNFKRLTIPLSVELDITDRDYFRSSTKEMQATDDYENIEVPTALLDDFLQYLGGSTGDTDFDREVNKHRNRLVLFDDHNEVGPVFVLFISFVPFLWLLQFKTT